MENRPILNRQILEALEACRPGSEDGLKPGRRQAELSDLAAAMADSAELARLYERLQRVDTAIGEAFRDVPIPEGLEDRILARLGVAAHDAGNNETTNQAGADQQAEAPPEETLPVALPATTSTTSVGRFVSRRWLLSSAGGVVAAGLLVGGLLFFGDSSEDLTHEQVYRLAMDYFKSDADAHSGEEVDLVPPPSDYPLSPDVRRGRQTTWRRISGFLGTHEGVAYDISRDGGHQATLYVVRRPVDRLPGRPPAAPRLSTRGLNASAWTSGRLLYVLVVQGSKRDYSWLVVLPSGTLT